MDGRREKGYIGNRTSMTVCLTWHGSSLDIGAEILNSSADDRRRMEERRGDGEGKRMIRALSCGEPAVNEPVV